MTNTKLFEKLRGLIENADSADSADKKHIKKIRKVLHKLKDRQRKLERSLEDIDSEHERQKVEQDIQVIQLQRQKGVEVYRQLKQDLEDRKKNRKD
jgi:hypothetical protein